MPFLSRYHKCSIGLVLHCLPYQVILYFLFFVEVLLDSTNSYLHCSAGPLHEQIDRYRMTKEPNTDPLTCHSMPERTVSYQLEFDMDDGCQLIFMPVPQQAGISWLSSQQCSWCHSRLSWRLSVAVDTSGCSKKHKGVVHRVDMQVVT